MANVRSTLNHSYSTDDCLGIGATCEVYKGISKSGDIRALKVFGPRTDGDIGREIQALKQLDHRNIIKYYGCEEEIGSRRLVVVTEFCDGGSLLDHLNRPENAYGLDEEEYLLLLRHLVDGMKHYREKGFIHRDIKPANILRCISEDGSSLYKLSDFGTAKPLMPDECFQSLVGTEEYLHPDIYKAAFLERGRDRQFDQSVDLWSLGATLYHSATGRVPFRPHHGRADKLTMFEMIAKKPAGVISGVQTKHRGEIRWCDELPTTCPMSQSFKKRMASMIVCLMEADTKKMWTFEDFFQDAEGILKKEAIVVLSPTSFVSPFCRLYINASQSVRDTQKELERQTGVLVTEQLLMLEDVLLTEMVKETDSIQELRRTSQEEPVILLPGRTRHDDTRDVDPVLAEIEDDTTRFSSSAGQPDVDFKHAKRLMEHVALIHRHSHVTSLAQRHFIGVRRRLRRKQKDREDSVGNKHSYVSDLFEHVNYLATTLVGRQGPSVASGSIMQTVDKIRADLEVCGGSLAAHSYAKSDDVSLEAHAWCFENCSCERKYLRWFDRAKDIVPHFYERRKKRTFGRLDERVHQIEKAQLQQIHNMAREHWTSHCVPKNKFLQDSFHQWAKNYYETEDRLQTVDNKLEDIQKALAALSRQIADSQKSQMSLSSFSDSVRQKSLSIDKGVKEELSKTKEMKAIVLDFKNKYYEVLSDLEPPVEIDLHGIH
ncbi:serine/threonine-protein kinase TBK1-like [Haliotis rufescens]|uniref:serine/threonine-protein kinase TBK1-like n=1 Tax=Haliotis rufescens TaxID=6454 RepID=UPI00201F6F84|nr:serine/threonine-protein kinase TBK1-like [Haliotis rufescens]